MPAPRQRLLPALGLACCLALPLGCAPVQQGARPADRSVIYLPHLAADVYLPEVPVEPERPVVVLVPGGGWLTADPGGLRPLAARLAARGVPAVTATYRAADDGVRLPAAVADISCAAGFAAQATERPGRRPVVLAGHSSGAHLAAVAALVPRDPAPPCPYPAAKIVGYIGLAGPYDLSSFAEAAEPLLGATLAEDPAAWRAADPLWLGRHPPAGLRVLLVHGSADPVVPPAAGASGRGRGRGDRSATETRDLTTPWAGANDSRSEDLRLCHTGGRLAQIGGEARQRADRDEDQETS